MVLLGLVVASVETVLLLYSIKIIIRFRCNIISQKKVLSSIKQERKYSLKDPNKKNI